MEKERTIGVTNAPPATNPFRKARLLGSTRSSAWSNLLVAMTILQCG